VAEIALEQPKKPKLDLLVLASWEQANDALSEIGIAQAKIAETKAQHEQIEQARKAQLAKDIADHEATIERYATGLQAFAVSNRDDLGAKKSRELMNGILGFRVPPPSVSQLGKIKKDVTLTIISQTEYADELIRTKAELNKESVLAKFATGELDEKKLREFGLRIDQDEEFYIKVNDNRITKEAA